jgi:hypothetical protein
MTLGEHVFLYCERGTSTALSAEPINAVSNIAFILAALMGLQLLEWRPREQQTSDHFLLIGLVALIGIGSFARFYPEPISRRSAGLDGAAGDRLYRPYGRHHAGEMLGRRRRSCGP